MRVLSLQSFGAVAFVLGCLGATAAQAGGYTIVDLGKGIVPTQINEKGEISANVYRSTGSTPSVLRNGRLHHLCCSRDGFLAYAAAINGHGDVVGQDGNENDNGPAIMWQRGGIRIELPVPEGSQFIDQVSGVALDGTTVGTYYIGVGIPRCFRTSPTGPAQDLGLMGQGDSCEVGGINKSGQIAGAANIAQSGPFRAFVWRDGVFQNLGVLPGTLDSGAAALNDRGDVVGASDRHPVLWSHGQVRDLDPANLYDTEATVSINNSGVIVGYANLGNGLMALRFDASGPIPLINEVANLDDWLQLNRANSVNDEGVIVGSGVRAGDIGHSHAFMLVPLPQQ
jgi:probable HAF family extracellular repeat protein